MMNGEVEVSDREREQARLDLTYFFEVVSMGQSDEEIDDYLKAMGIITAPQEK